MNTTYSASVSALGNIINTAWKDTAVGKMFRRDGCCMARELNAGHQKAIKTTNQSLENAAKSKYLGLQQ
jgi:hypothetical protein